jgi:hypothetical protein
MFYFAVNQHRPDRDADGIQTPGAEILGVTCCKKL